MNGLPPALWARLSPLLDEFLDLPPEAHAARLAAVRASDPELGAALAEMLGHLPAIEGAGFLETPALPRPADLAGQAVGAYTLVRELGHGGMGTVWLARRTDGRYSGEVAIKFLRAGLFGHGDARRFQREGDILARLAHPHIARLLDAGTSADGTQPWLVLEYIDGLPIDQYCAQRALTTPQRLALFLDVLDAVAHAHNRLILHRDLKPSNILVTATGDVKLLDFGIAKLLDDTTGTGAATELTMQAGQAFTPQFAAPEQLLGGDVTTATDVYALGVLLYLLLAGEHPTVGATTGAPLERMRAVVETEPRLLSDAVLRRGSAAAPAESADVRKRAHELRGDLDTILAKALRKPPAQRYANATALADDVRRYLAHQPIAARPDSRLYRAAKFLRRNVVAVGAGVVVVGALSTGIAVAAWNAREARTQRMQAEKLVGFMLGDLHGKLDALGKLDLLDDVGREALAYYAAQDPARLDPAALSRRAAALHQIGDVADRRGQFAVAQHAFDEAAQTTSALLRHAPNDPQRVFDQAQSEFWLAQSLYHQRRLDDALAGFHRYDALADRLNVLAPGHPDWHLEKLYALSNLATLDLDLGHVEEALAETRQLAAGFERELAQSPERALDAADAYGWLGLAETQAGHCEAGIAAQERKAAIAREATDGGRNGQAMFYVAHAQVEIGIDLLNLGRLDEAASRVRAGLTELTRLSEADPSNTERTQNVVDARLTLARILAGAGDAAGALAQLDRVRAATGAPSAGSSDDGQDRRRYARGLDLVQRADLATEPAEQARLATALQAWIADMDRFQAEGHQLLAYERFYLAMAHRRLGNLRAAAGDSAAARTEWLAARDIVAPVAARGRPAAMTLLGRLELALGHPQEARAWADKVRATPFRHPAFIALQHEIGQAP